MIDPTTYPRYFLTFGDGPQYEVTKQAFIAQERACGFRPRTGDGLATAGFGNSYISGTILFRPPNDDGRKNPSVLQDRLDTLIGCRRHYENAHPQVKECVLVGLEIAKDAITALIQVTARVKELEDERDRLKADVASTPTDDGDPVPPEHRGPMG